MNEGGLARLWVGHDERGAANVVPHLTREEHECDDLEKIYNSTRKDSKFLGLNDFLVSTKSSINSSTVQRQSLNDGML